MNSDVCIKENGTVLAVLVKDEDRNVVQAFSETVNFKDPAMVEAAGLLASVRVAKDLGYPYVIFEGYCSNIFRRLMTSLDDINWELRKLLLDCRVILQSFNMWAVSLVSREANTGSNNLAHWCWHRNILGFISLSVVPTSFMV